MKNRISQYYDSISNVADSMMVETGQKGSTGYIVIASFFDSNSVLCHATTDCESESQVVIAITELFKDLSKFHSSLSKMYGVDMKRMAASSVAVSVLPSGSPLPPNPSPDLN